LQNIRNEAFQSFDPVLRVEGVEGQQLVLKIGVGHAEGALYLLAQFLGRYPISRELGAHGGTEALGLASRFPQNADRNLRESRRSRRRRHLVRANSRSFFDMSWFFSFYYFLDFLSLLIATIIVAIVVTLIVTFIVTLLLPCFRCSSCSITVAVSLLFGFEGHFGDFKMIKPTIGALYKAG
jgi:hypothetical protein